MTPTLAPRILAFPADVRAALAAVPGPGWICVRRVDGCLLLVASYGLSRRLKSHEAWWPANPAAAVCAVCDVLPHAAHQLISDACPGLDEGDDDHSAALSIIEAHIRSRP